MKYDDASWHYGGDYPKELPPENAAIHIGMFLKWCICQNFYSESLMEDSEEEIKKVQVHSMTGAQFLMHWDEKFVDDMLSETGNLFAKDYYAGESEFSKKYNDYGCDFCDVFNRESRRKGFEYESLYHVEDTADNYNLMSEKINERFQQWITMQTR